MAFRPNALGKMNRKKIYIILILRLVLGNLVLKSRSDAYRVQKAFYPLPPDATQSSSFNPLILLQKNFLSYFTIRLTSKPKIYTYINLLQKISTLISRKVEKISNSSKTICNVEFRHNSLYHF